MKFTIQREALLKPLQFVNGAIEKRQALPILSNVFLRIKDKQLWLLGTNLEMELTVSLPLEEDESLIEGDVTVSARKFMDICRALPEQTRIEFYTEDQKAFVKAGRGRFTLATLPATGFPRVEDSPNLLEFSLSREDFLYLIKRTCFAIANQDVRYYLNGMLLEITQNTISTVSTDGHRLALSSIATTSPGKEAQVIIPRKSVFELMRLSEDLAEGMDINIGANHIRITAGEYIFTSKLIDARFPDYERVLPQNGDKYIILPREILKEALARVAILSNEKYRGVYFQLRSGMLRIMANNPEQEEAEEEILFDYYGEDLEVGFNVNYLIDVFSAVETEDVCLTLLDANSGMRIEEVNPTKSYRSSVYVVMPMRL